MPVENGNRWERLSPPHVVWGALAGKRTVPCNINFTHNHHSYETCVPCHKEKLPPHGADVGVLLGAAPHIRVLPVARDLTNIISNPWKIWTVPSIDIVSENNGSAK